MTNNTVIKFTECWYFTRCLAVSAAYAALYKALLLLISLSHLPLTLHHGV